MKSSADLAKLSDSALTEVLERLLGSRPSLEAVALWAARLEQGLTAEAFITSIAATPNYKFRKVSVGFPAGHFHSAVVDPALVHRYVAERRATAPSDIAAIEISLDKMKEFWTKHAEIIASTAFPEQSDLRWRYHVSGGPFPFSDAAMLRTMIHVHRPRRIVEIGSGYSTACILDTADECGLLDLKLTCVEPNPARLLSLMRPNDANRVTLVQREVQGMPLGIFRELEAGDILFVDSTHVLKTGSDVHFELFHILPVLRPGVLVHFHDCIYPFEYPDKWIFEENYSWNEVYALQAFLMWNSRFSVYFWGSALATKFQSLIRQTCPRFLPNSGGSLWLRVQI